MSEVPSFNPSNMRDLFEKGKLVFAEEEAVPEKQYEPEVELPLEGKIVERDGKKYRWEKVRSDAEVMDRKTWTKEPYYYTLRTWFAHTSQVETGGEWVNGPGWDSRRHLPDYSDREMLERFGYVFTPDEIQHPAGIEDFQTGEITDAMPDIPYLTLELLNDTETE